MAQKRHLLRCVLPLAIICLNACSSLLPESESQRQFVLSPLQQEASSSSESMRWAGMSVRVALNSRFDTNRLLMLSPEQELMPYHGARWALALPELLRERWSQALESSGLVGLSYGEGAKQGLRPGLVIHLRDFQARLSGDHRALCQVAIVLEFLGEAGEAPASIHLQASREVDTHDAAWVAAGFNQAHEEVLMQGLSWLMQR